MQKIATRVFIGASLAFGLFGLALVLTIPAHGESNSPVNEILFKLVFASGFVVLSSFALSVAGKYLDGK